MAERPITWALGMAAVVLVGGLYYGERFASASGLASHAPPATPAAPAPSASPHPTLAVAADYNGHFLVHPTIENYRIRMMVDTGATVVALTAQDARAIGLKPAPSDYRMPMSTANGVVMAARVVVKEMRLGDIAMRNVEAVVMPPGALSMNLLGTSFLRRLRGYEVQTGRMILRG